MRTLIVDITARPVKLVPTENAVSKLAEAIENNSGGYETLVAHPHITYRSQYLEIPAPVIMMMPKYVELREKDKSTVNKRVLFARDRYACQYCDYVATAANAHKTLTVDHVKPVRLFNPKELANTWENVTTACRSCNQAKGGKLPMQCGMMPRNTPRVPHYVQLMFAGRLNPEQRNYVKTYFRWDDEKFPL